MFTRPHHQRIAKVLESLDADLLKRITAFLLGVRQSPWDMVSIVNRLI